jgi:hypothetical protein
VRLSGWRCRLAKAGVMSARRNISVTRTYTVAPEACVRALTLLLKKSVSKEGAKPAQLRTGEAKSSMLGKEAGMT